jgi:hypothetical protein
MIDAVRVRDYSCNHYLIPTELSDDFQIMLMAIDHSEWGSDSWYDATDHLTDMFAEYLVS